MPLLPLTLELSVPPLYGGAPVSVSLNKAVTVFVGPNGSGKSQALRQVKNALEHRVGTTRFLASGRLMPLEGERTGNNTNPPRYRDPTITLQEVYRRQWHAHETVDADLDQLGERPDLQVKVTERLRRLFKRDLRLTWERGNLRVRLTREGMEAQAYNSAREASGLLHLIGLLAALYNDKVQALLVDEPELSLHPQLQAFLLQEIERYAGEPEQGRKLVVLSTHAPAMVRLRTLSDLPGFVFFTAPDTPPVQIGPTNGVLQSPGLAAFVRRMGAAHREALFSARPLLVEGPSDAIVSEALAEAREMHLAAAGGHVLPVTGKGEVPEAMRLMRLLGKRPAALVDLDAVTDGLELVTAFKDVPEGREAAQAAGHTSLHSAVKGPYDQFCAAVQAHWQTIEEKASLHPYWTAKTDNRGKTDAEVIRKRRSAAAILLAAEEKDILSWTQGAAVWLPVRRQLDAALNLLERAGCFVLRRGTVEDYYDAPGGRADKLLAAEEEAQSIVLDPHAASARHDVVVRALKYVADAPQIDEATAVAKAFAAAAGAVLAELRQNPQATSERLQAEAERVAHGHARLFRFERIDVGAQPGVRVQLAAALLDVEGFPIELARYENVNDVAESRIRSRPRARAR